MGDAIDVLALLYDVHGNLPALEAVLDDAAARGAERFGLGGDYALFGPFPVETVARLRELDAFWIRGNGERWTGDPGADDAPEPVRPAIAACREALGEELATELAALPFDHAEAGARFCHASPRLRHAVLPPRARRRRGRACSRAWRTSCWCSVTPTSPSSGSPRAASASSTRAASGCRSTATARAAYALLGDDGRVEHRRVPYDHAASATAVRERFDGDWAATVARRIETARF